MFQSAEFRSKIRADKFYSPQVDRSDFVERERLANYLCGSKKQSPPTVVVEAQAGQGKTTFINQFLDSIEIASAWYQIGPEDNDPAFFLQALQVCLSGVCDEYPSADIRPLLEGTDFSKFDHQQKMNLLLQDLDRCLPEKLYLVLDDVHFLSRKSKTLELLLYLLETAPPSVQLIIASRVELPTLVEPLPNRNRTVIRLSNADLALQTSEIKEYFNTILQIPVSVQTVEKIALLTEGWPMGVRLYGLQLGVDSSSELILPLLSPDLKLDEDLRSYFTREVFSQLDVDLHRPLLILSLLDHISVELAVELTGDLEIGQRLIAIAKRNLFLRSIGAENKFFAFHHLFRESLRMQARQQLEPDEIKTIYNRAGIFSVQQEDPASAMSYFIQAGEYDSVEYVLQEHGMYFVARDQSQTIYSILGALPEGVLRHMGWASFYLGLASMDLMPSRALPLLHGALKIFCDRGNRLGELLVLSHIISIIIMTSGHYREGGAFLQRADKLFTELAKTLSPTMYILVSKSICMGLVIFQADTDKSIRYLSRALKIAKDSSMASLEAALLMVRGYTYIFAGRTLQIRQALEDAAPFVFRPEIGPFNGLAIRMMLFNFHFHDGDFFNYEEQKKQLIGALGKVLVSQSIAGPFCYIWEMDIAICQGRYDDAIILAERALAEEPAYGNHIISQILQLEAVAEALNQNKSRALQLAEKSSKLREVTGGPYFVTANKILTGVCYALCDQVEQGLLLLEDGVACARKMETEYLEACALLHRAAILLEIGEISKAGPDLELGMGLMRKNNYHHFWAWIPGHMENVLRSCITLGIEVHYARKLADARFEIDISDEGFSIPLLLFKTLGDFQIECRSQVIFQANDLTPAQRELFCLLLATPGNSLSSEAVQLYFWPDSSPRQLQNKLDTMVSRLRKKLAQRLPSIASHTYLSREKGIISLKHVRCDCTTLINHVETGVEHFNLQRYWQAENQFCLANRLWGGDFIEGTGVSERILALRMRLTSVLEEMVITWTQILIATHRQNEAVHLIEKALRTDWLNDRLFGLLYKVEGQHSLLRAKKVVARFEKRLHQEGYSCEEISHLLNEFVTS